MPTLIQSDAAKGILATPNPSFAGEVAAFRTTVALTANPVVNDVFEMGAIPANCRLVDIIIDSDDMDTNGAPTMAFDVGIMTGEVGKNDSTRTVNAVFFAAATAAQTGVAQRPTLKTAYRDVPTDQARSVGLKCTAVAATFAAGTFGVTILVASA